MNIAQLHSLGSNINMVQLTGNFKRTSETNYNEFLTKLGVGYLTRKAATASVPTMEITENNGKWKMVTSTTLTSMVLEFQLVCTVVCT